MIFFPMFQGLPSSKDDTTAGREKLSVLRDWYMNWRISGLNPARH